MSEDPELARRYARMFHETSRPLARQLARVLDLRGARRLLDLGGGSGIISLALLRANPELTAVVIDIDHVCAAGREIADDTQERDRIAYRAVNLLHDALPTGFDVVLECRVGVYEAGLFQKIAGALNEGGRLIIVDELVHQRETPSLDRLNYAFLNALQNPAFALPTIGSVWQQINAAGFGPLAERHLAVGKTVLEARLL